MAFLPYLNDVAIVLLGKDYQISQQIVFFNSIISTESDSEVISYDFDSRSEDGSRNLSSIFLDNPHIWHKGCTFNFSLFQINQKILLNSINNSVLFSLDYSIDYPPPEA